MTQGDVPYRRGPLQGDLPQTQDASSLLYVYCYRRTYAPIATRSEALDLLNGYFICFLSPSYLPLHLFLINQAPSAWLHQLLNFKKSPLSPLWRLGFSETQWSSFQRCSWYRVLSGRVRHSHPRDSARSLSCRQSDSQELNFKSVFLILPPSSCFYLRTSAACPIFLA